ncbi:pyridoxal-phosphate-dependent aminotransferase family protein [Aminipila luticellarii]|uniref:Alanine--glyoxylate aminotransferase family protein n=1 Tax=Aminipila luticellarii TaxID=2507160 RepID=A0A410PYK9_9FIRM|nr:alanine--glyoxylate aminotransferase family protein [Aminipila luticellarii]QAT43974.1 alanine--glyoxylate aminotransferase family protein [Aminipila luticellarii]
MYKTMTPGPTNVRENVRMARSLETTNPDIDPAFYEFYKETCELLARLLHTKNNAYILGGEGILGLETACASLTEPRDRVLILDNGVFGRGFADFVTMYGGETVSFVSDYHRPISVSELEDFLKKDSDFKYATVVHCDTPSGVLNPINEICNLLASYGILTVVDSVAGMFGEYVNIDESKIDILCGGSQKALSAPPGLTMLWVSDRAMEMIENRKTPIASFYANILNFKDYYKKQEFPYTMPISDIYGLRAAAENVAADKNILERHARIAAATRKALTAGGLSFFLEDGFANTVTAVSVPEGLTDRQILDTMKNRYHVMITGSFDTMAGKVLRIGHMGENANEADLCITLRAMTQALKDLGFPVACSMDEAFQKALAEDENR